jgi:hypothetical protein
LPDPTCDVLARWIFQAFHFVEVVVVDSLFNGPERFFDVVKVVIQPSFGSTGPRTWTSIWKLCPCNRPHLCPAGT